MVADNGDEIFNFRARSSTKLISFDHPEIRRLNRQKEELEYDNQILSKHRLDLIAENNHLKCALESSRIEQMSMYD